MSLFSNLYEEHLIVIQRDTIQNIFGMDINDDGIITNLVENTPAYNSNIKVNDQIIAVNMIPVFTSEQICNVITKYNSIIFTVKRTTGTWV
jgi:C-terminal processing protease CtpA/Prc